MDIVIKLDDELYNEILSRKYSKTRLEKAVANGTPLRKGHSKLIDVKDLLEQICLEDTEQNRKLNLGEIITLEDIDRIEAIIEEDKEE